MRVRVSLRVQVQLYRKENMMTPSTKVILKANDVPIHSIIDMGNYLWECTALSMRK